MNAPQIADIVPEVGLELKSTEVDRRRGTKVMRFGGQRAKVKSFELRTAELRANGPRWLGTMSTSGL
jgi:hypothetical protein